MSLQMYDDAVLEKLTGWTKDTECHVYGHNETRRLFEVVASDGRDSPITLPLICLRRIGGFQIINPNKTVLSFDAMTAQKDKKETLSLNAIPINIEYQLDIYSKFQEEAEEYIREIVFNIINNPTCKVEIPYNGLNFIHNATLRILNDIDDTSEIPERLVQGQFTRYSLHLTVDDAYLWDVKRRLNKYISAVYVQADECEKELVTIIEGD